MKPKPLYIILIICLLVAVLMTSLNYIVEKPNRTNTLVPRTIINNALKEIQEIDLPYAVQNIISVSDSTIYMFNRDPYKLITYNYKDKKLGEIKLKVPSFDHLERNFSILGQSPNFYIIGSNIPAVIHYNLNTQKYQVIRMNKLFSKSAVWYHSNIVLRIFDSTGRNQYLKRVNPHDGSFTDQHHVIEKRNDGGFSTAGSIGFDRKTSRIVYVHYYSNRIYYMDTNLNLLHTGKTIDTFSSYQASAKSITKNGKTSYSYDAPPKIINSLISVDNGMLYVLSQIRAENERSNDNSKNNVIDVYNMINSDYNGSIYLPNEANNHIIAFKVIEGHLFALHKNNLKLYTIKSLLQ